MDCHVPHNNVLAKTVFKGTDGLKHSYAFTLRAELDKVRKLLRHAQFRWDYVAANHGMGFHSPLESMRVLGDSARQALAVRVLVAKLLAGKGVVDAPDHPDISTREKAWAVAKAFVDGKDVDLLP